MEKQVLLNDINYIDLDFNKNRFIILGKEEQAEYMKRKLAFIVKQCEEIVEQLKDESLLVKKKS
ncbi:hypothetical protein J4416_01540 [Candidatus Pacearchaeota archaeon]|nr:hypothetical protein [uncultured archaeon]AQS34483.1 hypothetical protein [uncultured archaeon]MBS3081605.1 hypothetical protein [Candidatus Pacearchaeota archaeon]